MNDDEIEDVFDTKKDTLLELKDAQDLVDEAKRQILQKKLVIAEHDILMREQNTLDKVLIKGKNETEREQCLMVHLKKETKTLDDARDILSIAKLNDEIATLNIQAIDYKLRNRGV